METALTIFAVIAGAWSAFFGYSVSFSIVIAVVVACFTFNAGLKRGRKEKAVVEARDASAQAMWRRQGYDEEHNAKEERKLAAEKERWHDWTVERELRKEEQAERQLEYDRTARNYV